MSDELPTFMWTSKGMKPAVEVAIKSRSDFIRVRDYRQLEQRIAELEKTIEVERESAQGHKEQAERFLKISENPANHPDVKRVITLLEDMKRYLDHRHGTRIYHDSIFHKEIEEALSALQGEKDA